MLPVALNCAAHLQCSKYNDMWYSTIYLLPPMKHWIGLCRSQSAHVCTTPWNLSGCVSNNWILGIIVHQVFSSSIVYYSLGSRHWSHCLHVGILTPYKLLPVTFRVWFGQHGFNSSYASIAWNSSRRVIGLLVACDRSGQIYAFAMLLTLPNDDFLYLYCRRCVVIY